MGEERDLGLLRRRENTREQRRNAGPVVGFTLDQIKAHFDDTVRSIEQQFSVADKLIADGNTADAENIWRWQIVYVEGALDFYLHEMSKYAVVSMFLERGAWAKSEKYQNLPIPMRAVEEGMRSPSGSAQWLLEQTNEVFCTPCFLGYESMRDQVNLMGLRFNEIVSAAFPGNRGKEKINRIYARRNRIAHQADRAHSDAQQSAISKACAEEMIAFIGDLVNAIHREATRKES